MADSFGAAPVGGAHQIGRLVRGYLDRAIERVHCFELEERGLDRRATRKYLCETWIAAA
jgi:hypothetical protein